MSAALWVAVAACGSADQATPGSSADPDAGASAAGNDGAVPAPGDASARPPGTSNDAAADATATTGSYDQDGSVPFTTKVEQVTNGGHTFNVTSYVPMTSGLHPAVSFSCGSTQTAAGYVPYATRLASHGIAMFLRDDPGALTKTADIIDDAVYVVSTWLPATYASTIDSKRIGLGGHSRGGAVSLLAGEGGLKGKVVAWFGLDPVDNQFGMSPGAFARTNVGQIGIPTAYLGASVTSNCAPAADGYATLFPATAAPSVLLLGNGAGHTQLEVASACTACGLCSPSGTVDSNVVLAYATRYFFAFFARELLGDTSVGAKFDGAGAPADVAAGLITVTSK